MEIHITPKKAVSFVLSFVLFLSLLTASVGLFAKNSFMNVGFVDRTVTGSAYASLLTAELQQQMCEYGANSGVSDGTVFTDIVTEARVAADTKTYFQGAMDGVTLLDVSGLEKELYQSIYAYARQGDLSQVSEEELETNINHLVDLCVSSYKQGVAVGMLPQIGKAMRRVGRYADLVAFGCLFLSALIIAVINLLNRFFRTTLRFTIYAVSAAALTWWVMFVWVKASGVISRVALTSRPLYVLATGFMNALLNRALVTALIFTAVMAVLLFCYYIVAPRLARRIRRH